MEERSSTGWLSRVFVGLTAFHLFNNDELTPSSESDKNDSLSEVSDLGKVAMASIAQSYEPGTPKRMCLGKVAMDSIAQDYEPCIRKQICKTIPSWQETLIKREESIENMLQQLKTNVVSSPFLKWIFVKLPKGGDLHMHLEGSFPPPILRRLVIECELYYNETTRLFYSKDEFEEGKTYVFGNDLCSKKWEDIFDEISIRSISKSSRKAGGKFFDAFETIGSILNHVPLNRQLEIARENARLQNIGYNEFMGELSKCPKPTEFLESFPSEISEGNLEKAHQQLIELGYIQNYLEESKKILDSCKEEFFNNKFDDFSSFYFNIKKAAEMNQDEKDPTFSQPVQIGLNLEVMRNRPNGDFFASAAAVMAMAQNDERVFGFTVDGPQHESSASDNFLSQLKMIEFLRKKYPDVKITYHAMEVNERLATLEELQMEPWHIIRHADPDRWGHFTTVADSKDPTKLLSHLKNKQKCVEVSLSSVKITTGTKPKKNPIFMILQSGIPVTLNTDDEGLTFSNLSREYLKGYKYGITYKDISIMIRTSLHYSFLPGQSLYRHDWLERSRRENSVRRASIYHPLFKEMHKPDWTPSFNAIEFLRGSRKARLQFMHEIQINNFEEWLMGNFRKSLVECNHYSEQP